MIRLQRFGRKNNPSFRVVLTDKRNSTKSGKFSEILGFKNPKTKEKKLEAERIKYWISKGAKVSPTMHNMLITEKIITGKKINMIPLPKKETAKIEDKPNKEPEVLENDKENMASEVVDNNQK